MTLLGTTNNPFGKSGRRYEERTSLTDFLNQIEQRDQMYKNLPKPSKEEIENRRISEEERRLEDIAFNNKALAVGTVLCLGEGFYHGITGNYLPGKLLIPFLTSSYTVSCSRFHFPNINSKLSRPHPFSGRSGSETMRVPLFFKSRFIS